MTAWHHVPEPVIDLLRRIKDIEHADGSWPGADVVDEVTQWLTSYGIDPDVPADQVPEPEEARTYRRQVAVEVTSHWRLDEADLDKAIRSAITGTAVRVEFAETLDTDWCEIAAIRVSSP